MPSVSSPSEPTWIPDQAIIAIYHELLAEHGGASGILNHGMLSSTLARPRNLLVYGGDHVTIYDLATAYGYGFAKNHCFVDGNKRVALASIAVFLRLNGYELTASQEQAVLMIRDVVEALETDTDVCAKLSQWIKGNSRVRPGSEPHKTDLP